MIFNRNKAKKGFTLIELLVVISIIALLSSVVLAGVKVAQEKAKATAFRASTDQFIKALEMYRNDHNGMYPGEEYLLTGSYMFAYGIDNLSVVYRDPDPAFDLKTVMLPYIKKLPIPTTSGATIIYKYELNTYQLGKYRCHGDTIRPKYVILIYDQQGGFEDWANLEENNNNKGIWTEDTYNNIKCFSLK